MFCLLFSGLVIPGMVFILYQINILLSHGKILSDVALMYNGYYDVPSQTVENDDFLIEEYKDVFDCVELYGVRKNTINLEEMLFKGFAMLESVRQQFMNSDSGVRIVTGPYQTADGLYYLQFQMRWMGAGENTNLIYCYYQGGYKAIIPEYNKIVQVDTGVFFSRIKQEVIRVPARMHQLTVPQSEATMRHFEQQYNKRVVKETLNFIGFTLKVANEQTGSYLQINSI